jgi:integrase
MWYDMFKKDLLVRRAKSSYLYTQFLYSSEYRSNESRDIKPLHVQALVQSASGLSVITQRKIIGTVRAILELAVENSIISRSPVTSSIKAQGAPPKAVEPLTREQTDALLKATRNPRLYTFIVLALYAGLRKGEILGLQWRDIDFTVGVIHVRRSIVFRLAHCEGVVMRI